MLRKVLSGILLLFFLLPTPVWAVSTTTNEQADVHAAELVIVLDISQSMRLADKNGRLRNELATWVESLGSNTRVSLIRYNLNILEEDSGFYAKGEQGFSDLTVRIRADMKDSYSDTGAALLEAYNRLQNSQNPTGYKAILLISDDELDIRSKSRTEDASKQDIEDLLSGKVGDMPFDLHYLHVTYAGKENSVLIDTMRKYESVNIHALSEGESIDAKLDLLKMFMADVKFMLLTPQLVDDEWVESDHFPLDNQIELYAYFTLNGELVTNLAYLNSFTYTVNDGEKSSEMQLAQAQDSFYAPLRYDKAGQHTITVTASSGTSGLSFTKSMTLHIEGEPEAPSTDAPEATGTGQTQVDKSDPSSIITTLYIVLFCIFAFIVIFLFSLKRKMNQSGGGKPIERTVRLSISRGQDNLCEPFEKILPKQESIRLSTLISSKAGSVQLGDVYKINVSNTASVLLVSNNSQYSCINEDGAMLTSKRIPLPEGKTISFHHAEDFTTVIRLECVKENIENAP